MPRSLARTFVGSGGPTTTIADLNSAGSMGQVPSISDQGLVGFLAGQKPSGLPAIFVGNGGPITPIVTVFPNSPFVGLGEVRSINNGGTVAFVDLRRQQNGEGIFIGDGGAVQTLYDQSAPLSGFSNPSLNDSGTVVFVAHRVTGGSGVFSGNGSPPVTIADTSGPFGGFSHQLSPILVRSPLARPLTRGAGHISEQQRDGQDGGRHERPT